MDNVSFLFEISDLAGNKLSGISSTSDNSSVRVDRSKPVISGITLVSSNDNGSWAKSGDNLTLDFTTSEVVQRPSVMLAGSSLHADNTSQSGKQWRLVYPVQSGDNGTVDLDFSVKDLAGNVSDNVTQDNA